MIREFFRYFRIGLALVLGGLVAMHVGKVIGLLYEIYNYAVYGG
jgi:hypothetical protein